MGRDKGARRGGKKKEERGSRMRRRSCCSRSTDGGGRHARQEGGGERRGVAWLSSTTESVIAAKGECEPEWCQCDAIQNGCPTRAEDGGLGITCKRPQGLIEHDRRVCLGHSGAVKNAGTPSASLLKRLLE